LSINFVSIIRVQNTTDSLSGQEIVFASQANADISTYSELKAKQYSQRPVSEPY